MRFFLPAILLFFISCNNPLKQGESEDDGVNKKLLTSEKKNVFELPEELNEISGITFLNDSVLVAIQDENGTLYYYNINQSKIIKIQRFAGEEDFEDLVKVNEDMFVITSKGTIYYIKDFKAPNPAVTTFVTPFSSKNDIESIGYDHVKHRLLIGPKEYGLNSDKSSKQIYGFDLKTMSFIDSAIYTIQLKDIEAHFEGDAFEETSKKFLKSLGNDNMNKIFRTSALSVNHKTGDIYVLSSINGIIVVLDSVGHIKKIIGFYGPEYKQPEGIAFAPNGKLYISNEAGKSGNGNVIELIHEN